MQQKMVLYQLLQRHLEELKQKAILAENRFLEIQTTKEALKDLSPGKEMLVPLGSGCYTKSKTAEKAEILVDLGSGLVAKKGEKDLEDFLKKQEREMELTSKKVQEEMLGVANQLNALIQELEQLQK